ncbi:MAG: DUF2383 domain-containing protein [Vulcanibacillus sp.]
MDSKEFDSMRRILNGEKMASSILETYFKDIDDQELKKSMIKWTNNHKQNAIRISSYLMENGISPKENLGVGRLLAKTKARINTLRNSEPLDILREIYDGEDKGIERSVQITKNNLSENGTQMIEEIFSIDHDNLKEIKEHITKYEEENNQPM